jgi:hypothetical protein
VIITGALFPFLTRPGVQSQSHAVIKQQRLTAAGPVRVAVRKAGRDRQIDAHPASAMGLASGALEGSRVLPGGAPVEGNSNLDLSLFMKIPGGVMTIIVRRKHGTETA